ncbi:MAG TPA: ribosomal-processing cysteine protease Prp [Oscillospiraceae bacterium]|nr:ribosomal-processing cysteine protease Prp [Oscillospiraceae bacterium]
MTTVSVQEYYDSYIISVAGHAGFDEVGKDIVCAAISALTYTMINALKWAEDENCLYIRAESVDDGSVYLEVLPYDFSREKIDTIIETCIIGYSLIEEDYPDYITVSG